MSRGFSPSKSSSKSASYGRELNVLGQGLKVRGRLTGDGDLRIEGEIEGDVKLSGDLELSSKGLIAGNVSAKSVTIEGALTGDVDAETAVAIRAGARVSGNMSGTEISLEEGATFSGRIEADFELPDGLMAGAGPAGRRGK